MFRPAAPRRTALLLFALISWSAAPELARPGPLAPAPDGGKAAEAKADEDVSAVIARVERLRGHAPREDFRLLGASGDADALGLLETLSPQVTTIGGRLALLEAFGSFAGNKELEHRALSHVRSAAGNEPTRFLRLETLRVLAEAPGAARDYLAMLVESPLPDDLRITAMRLHIERANESDVGWYRTLLKTGGATATKRPAGGDAAATGQPHALGAVRALAFKALAPWLTLEELTEAAASNNSSQVRYALPELVRRADARASALAARASRHRGLHPEVRALALEIAAAAGNTGALLTDAIDEASHRDAPGALWRAFGPVIGAAADSSLVVDVARRWPRARDHEKPVLLTVLASAKDERGLQLVRRAVRDTKADVRLLAAELLATNGDLEARSELERAFERSREGPERGLLLTWIDHLLGQAEARDDAHQARLLAALDSRYAEERNAALQALGRKGATENTEAIVAALSHADWSTRMAALEALEALRTPAAVGAIVKRMSQEVGHPRRAFADALWRLTGQPHRDNASIWQRWWETAAEDFEPIAPEELAKLEREEAASRLEETAYVEFFGLALESHRVTFVLDVSGSMEWPTRGGTRDTPGEKRMEVARRELIRAIESLDGEAFFNIVTFSERARSWSREQVRATPEKQAEAVHFVRRLNAGGATAIYNALEFAFQDLAVDTIYLLSDGEPFGGSIDDQATIREHVRRWNASRGVVVHCVAIAENLELLRWLAEDTGGDYVFIP